MGKIKQQMEIAVAYARSLSEQLQKRLIIRTQKPRRREGPAKNPNINSHYVELAGPATQES